MTPGEIIIGHSIDHECVVICCCLPVDGERREYFIPLHHAEHLADQIQRHVRLLEDGLLAATTTPPLHGG